MADKKQFLVVMGVPSIKKYVFGTDTLAEIRGASALLDDLNRREMENILTRNSEITAEKVFVGGGAGQFVFTGDAEKIESCLANLSGIFCTETAGGLRLNWGKAEYTGENYKDARRLAELDAQTRIEEHPFLPSTSLHTGFIRECDSCSQMVSPHDQLHKGETKFLCPVCFKKAEYNIRKARRGLWKEFEEFLQTKEISVQQPENFEKIGEQCRAKKGYVALVYADGNAMGKIIRQIKDKQQFTFFSEMVDNSIRNACYEALYEILFNKTETPPKVAPVEILLLGGDDLLVYLTAEAALPFSIKVAEKFTALTREQMKSPQASGFREALREKGLTISLGITFGKSHTPFSLLLSQAEELLKSAKKGGASSKKSGGASGKEKEDGFVPTYIDYHLSTNYNQISVLDSRLQHLEKSGKSTLKLYRKPYSLEDAKALFDAARQLVDAGIPTTRLRRFGYAPSLGKVNGTLECLKLYTRSKKGEQRAAIVNALDRFGCWENIPWNSENPNFTSTVMVDLIELAGFYAKGSPDKGADDEAQY